MSIGTVPCPSCRIPLPGNLCNTPGLVTCPGCDSQIHVDVFPAQFRGRSEGRKAETILEAGVSSCFYHEGKKAVVPCDGCGRFLCALCDVELNQQHLCPACVEKSRTKGNLVSLETHRTVYDSAALSLSLWPLLIWPATILTAPAAVVLAILSFFRPPGLAGRRPGFAFAAIVLALAQMAGWIGRFFFSGE